MAYLTQQELQDRIGGLVELQRLSRSSPLDVQKVAYALSDAEASVNEFAKDSQGFPWTTTPDKAKEVTFAIARYYIYTRSWPGEPVPLYISDSYRQAKASLQELRDGESNWVTGISPAKQNVSEVFVSLPGDAPQTSPDARQARFGRLRKIL